jgi:hypothetical protein
MNQLHRLDAGILVLSDLSSTECATSGSDEAGCSFGLSYGLPAPEASVPVFIPFPMKEPCSFFDWSFVCPFADSDSAAKWSFSLGLSALSFCTERSTEKVNAAFAAHEWKQTNRSAM